MVQVLIWHACAALPCVGAGQDYSKERQFQKLNALKDIIEVKVTRDGKQVRHVTHTHTHTHTHTSFTALVDPVHVSVYHTHTRVHSDRALSASYGADGAGMHVGTSADTKAQVV